ncbi:MAG: glycine--tRNA ligase subunit beta [Gammaproteobacteria bacterium CG22_combo_CG10-13_8_21_14_all_40_8]|nr:MAG: glycine--tRNA ligase subunit beta [Gammaproteobacteria bacterium CG22_combo_CG10-13_8_21_14_all_40_8]
MSRLNVDFIIEIGTEELPPKALSKLAKAFHNNLTQSAKEARLNYTASRWLATPRRLTVILSGLSVHQSDMEELKLGPALDAAFDAEGNPKPAASGFARSCAVEVSQLQQIETDKGVRLGYKIQQAGLAAVELLPNLILQALKDLPIPKMMRWGDYNEAFVRPVKWILALLGSEVVPMTLFGQTSSNLTRGHRFHAPTPFAIENAASYEQQLFDQGKVIADFETRKKQIEQSANQIAQSIGSAIIDPNLLDEVAGLVEWPQAIIGTFDQEFLQVPEEALISSMQEHQKYFPVRNQTGQLSHHFIAMSNLESSHPQSVISGNEKVIRPRLADAKFFFDTDRKKSLADRIESLKTVLFQHKLGTVWDKSQRVVSLCQKIAPAYQADVEKSMRAAQLAKCDLMTEMVGEFPNLQGIMGRYYALQDQEPPEVALALDEQYMPRFSGDQLPSSNAGLVLALAERLDTLVGLFGIGQPPKGAKDPFALRRAALAVLRLLMQNKVDLQIPTLIQWALEGYPEGIISEKNAAQQLTDFIYQRFTAWYQEQGIDTNVIHSVMARKPLVVIDFDRRVKAVAHFRTLPEAESLAAANKRVANILDKNLTENVDLSFDATYLTDPAEIALHQAVAALKTETLPDFEEGDYQSAMIKLASLQAPLDSFFNDVMVMVEDEKLKNNRLALLQNIRALFLKVADISLLQ